MKLTHVDENGAARMVDVGDKQVTKRVAQAQAVITMRAETMQQIIQGTHAQRRCFCLRAYCRHHGGQTDERSHPTRDLVFDGVEIEITPISETQVRVVSSLRCTHKTGIEMEALTAASVAALTIYDMCKAIDRGMRIDEVLLLHKAGGKSGEYRYQA